MVTGTREESERLLIRSLSRHIGYTSGAYDLNRIFSTLEIFKESTSIYKEELIEFLLRSGDDNAEPLTSEYRSDILSFALSMGLLEVVSARNAKLVRVAATELGRSILGAQAIADKQFYNYYSAQVVLRADADFLIAILLFFQSAQPDSLQSFFVSFQTELRRKRLAWLIKSFPERILLERIADQLSWLSKKKGVPVTYNIDVPTMNTVRHHATPRQGWIEQLGMFDRKMKTLTPFGKDILRSLSLGSDYFWLAPPLETLDSLRITDRPIGASEEFLNFTSSQTEPSDQELAKLIDDLGAIMRTGFYGAKLIHASQASLQLPIEYIRYRTYSDQRNYEWESVLKVLFQEKRDKFERYSARKGKIGFYRVMG